jgi:hypothetical protein
LKEDIRSGIFQSVVDYARENHADEIDKAYEYFWEEESPEDFLSGTALSLAFVNFEDWLVCDWRDKDKGSLIDRYIKDKDPDTETRAILDAMKESVICLYEVDTPGEGVILRDMFLGEETITRDSILSTLKKGDIFAARFIEVDGDNVMGRGVYPFSQVMMESILQSLDKQYARYVKNKNPDGSKRQFLKEESYLLNMIWFHNLDRRS